MLLQTCISMLSPVTVSNQSSTLLIFGKSGLLLCRYYAIMNYPANGPEELNLKEGDLVIVHNRNLDGWCRGTHVSTGKTGHFPATFVERVTKDL